MTLDQTIAALEANEEACRAGRLTWAAFTAERARLDAIYNRALTEACIRHAKAAARA